MCRPQRGLERRYYCSSGHARIRAGAGLCHWSLVTLTVRIGAHLAHRKRVVTQPFTSLIIQPLWQQHRSNKDLTLVKLSSIKTYNYNFIYPSLSNINTKRSEEGINHYLADYCYLHLADLRSFQLPITATTQLPIPHHPVPCLRRKIEDYTGHPV